jgi:hypothetical protein
LTLKQTFRLKAQNWVKTLNLKYDIFLLLFSVSIFPLQISLV